MPSQKECKRCGTCCKKGGPALHHEDKALIGETLTVSNLVTIRKDEPAYNPILDKVAPSKSEFIKVSGKEKRWECLFFDATHSSCLIHTEKPIECRLLQCWDTGELAKLVGENYLTRFDIMQENDPMRTFILHHEKLCPYNLINELVDSIKTPGAKNNEALSQLSVLVQNDLNLRGKVVKKFNLSLGQELFYFGRPIFQVIDYESLIKNR
jgi:Fe-S-cluster containining protein